MKRVKVYHCPVLRSSSLNAENKAERINLQTEDCAR